MVLILLAMTWAAGDSQPEEFEAARGFYVASYRARKRPGKTIQGFQKALARLDYVGDEALLQAVTDRLIKARKVVGDARRVARADFKPKLSANQRKLKDKSTWMTSRRSLVVYAFGKRKRPHSAFEDVVELMMRKYELRRMLLTSD